jgi:calmodulin
MTKVCSGTNHIVLLTLQPADGDGRITATELAAVMHSLDQNPSDTDIANMVRAVDADGNGSIDFKEFLSMMATVGVDGGQLLIEEFRVFDKNGDGLISVMELKYVMSKLG